MIFTPGATFRGTDSFTYYVAGDGLVGVSAGTVPVALPLLAGQANTRDLAGSPPAFVLDAPAARWFQLEGIGNGATAVVTGPDGTAAFDGFVGPGSVAVLRAAAAGRYTVSLRGSGYPGEPPVSFRLLDLGGRPPVPRGQPVTGTLQEPPARASRSTDFYRLALTAGEPVRVSLAGSTDPRARLVA